tara:strand:- start:475 stop:711 length:237 start_codon:yes stop_codon:yes gene_type:complete
MINFYDVACDALGLAIHETTQEKTLNWLNLKYDPKPNDIPKLLEIVRLAYHAIPDGVASVKLGDFRERAEFILFQLEK